MRTLEELEEARRRWNEDDHKYYEALTNSVYLTMREKRPTSTACLIERIFGDVTIDRHGRASEEMGYLGFPACSNGWTRHFKFRRRTVDSRKDLQEVRDMIRREIHHSFEAAIQRARKG